MKQHISYEQFNTLPWSIKNKLRIIFQIKSTHEKVIVNNALKTDGIIPEDLVVINIGALIEALGDNWHEKMEDWGVDNLCDQLFDAVLAKIKDKGEIKESPFEENGKPKESVEAPKEEPKEETSEISEEPEDEEV